MIRVQEQPEPANFNTKVRIPGNAYLLTNPNPTSREFKKHREWSNALDDLYSAYNGICAYSASWISPVQSNPTADHYLPKHKYPQLAYEWSNLRLCNPKMNSYKDSFEDVIDPFQIQNGWFVIDFSTFLIDSFDRLPSNLKKSIKDSIKRLKLNDDDGLVQFRAHVVREYASGEISFDHLNRHHPFIAFELGRQNLQEAIKTMIK